jgi:prophage regulatory protein
MEILRLPQLMAKVGMSRSSVYAAIKNGHLPQPVKLTPGGRMMGWLSYEIDQYLKAMADRRGVTQ